MPSWLVEVIKILATFTAGFFLHVLKSKYDKKQFQLRLTISLTVISESAYVQIDNPSQEGINHFQVKYYWLQAGVTEERIVNRFFLEGQNVVMSDSQNFSYIGSGKTLIASSLPQFSDDARVRVICTGIGENNSKKIEACEEIVVGRRLTQ